jgi:hypothetical protein
MNVNMPLDVNFINILILAFSVQKFHKKFLITF